jgi:hypothetical protein
VNALHPAVGTPFDRRIPLRAIAWGLAVGLVFVAICVAFVAFSYFTDVPRRTWQTLDKHKNLVGVALFCVGGFLAARRSNSRWPGALAGGIAGFLAGVLVPVAIYALPYLFPESVRQNPYDDYIRGGADAEKVFLFTLEGRSMMFGSNVGLIPIWMPLLSLVGALLGFCGAALSTGFSKKAGLSR